MKGSLVIPNLILDYSSDEDLSPLNVTLIDAFGSMVPVQAHLMVNSLETRVGLLGSMGSGVIIKGTSNVSGIRIIGKPGKHCNLTRKMSRRRLSRYCIGKTQRIAERIKDHKRKEHFIISSDQK